MISVDSVFVSPEASQKQADGAIPITYTTSETLKAYTQRLATLGEPILHVAEWARIFGHSRQILARRLHVKDVTPIVEVHGRDGRVVYKGYTRKQVEKYGLVPVHAWRGYQKENDK